MKTKLLCLLLLMPLLFFAQQRELLQGRVISDTIKAEYLNVKNISANVATVTDGEGKFVIHARVGDTLKVSGIIIKEVYVQLKQQDFNDALVVIKVQNNITVLDEVLINGLTGNLAVDSKNAKIPKVDPRFDVAEINKGLYVNSIAGNGRGMDFMAIGRMISGPPKPKFIPHQVFVTEKPFATAVRELYSEVFFTDTLKISKEDIASFLHYCDEGEKVRYLLNPNNEFSLISYLSVKSKQYLKLEP